jgi:hypothetical protein
MNQSICLVPVYVCDKILNLRCIRRAQIMDNFKYGDEFDEQIEEQRRRDIGFYQKPEPQQQHFIISHDAWKNNSRPVSPDTVEIVAEPTAGDIDMGMMSLEFISLFMTYVPLIKAARDCELSLNIDSEMAVASPLPISPQNSIDSGIVNESTLRDSTNCSVNKAQQRTHSQQQRDNHESDDVASQHLPSSYNECDDYEASQTPDKNKKPSDSGSDLVESVDSAFCETRSPSPPSVGETVEHLAVWLHNNKSQLNINDNEKENSDDSVFGESGSSGKVYNSMADVIQQQLKAKVRSPSKKNKARRNSNRKVNNKMIK